MKLKKAFFERQKNTGTPVLRVIIDGKEALIHWEQKALDDAGLVYVGPDFGLPDKVIPADPKNGRPVDRVVSGFSDDPALRAVVELFREQLFSPDGGYQTGEIDLDQINA